MQHTQPAACVKCAIHTPMQQLMSISRGPAKGHLRWRADSLASSSLLLWGFTVSPAFHAFACMASSRLLVEQQVHSRALCLLESGCSVLSCAIQPRQL